MARNLPILSLGLLSVFASVLPVSADDIHKVIPISEVESVHAPLMRAGCSMQKHNGAPGGYYQNYQNQAQTVTYFDPVVECGSPAYPFRITDFSFTLYDPGPYTWPAYVNVVVYDAENPTGSCTVPGALLYWRSITAEEPAFGYPNVGTVSLPASWIVNGPFFIGLEYNGGTVANTPSILFDNNSSPVVCDNYMYNWAVPEWIEWYDFWADALPGYPFFWVDGETNLGDVTVQLNGGADVAYVGDTNVVELWFRNVDVLRTFQLGFKYSIGRDFEMISEYGTIGAYVKDHGDAVGAFELPAVDVSGIDNLSPDSIRFGATVLFLSGLPVHTTSSLCYSMAVYIPDGQEPLTDGFCIDNIVWGSWFFSDQSSSQYPPSYQGVPNISIDTTNAPTVCFDIVAPPDVGVSQIRSPVSGPAEPVIPEAVVKNYGGIDASDIPVHMYIYKTLDAFFYEGFEGSFEPDGWTQFQYSGTGLWKQEQYGNDQYEPGGTGTYYAEADSDDNPTDIFDVGLFTQPLNLSAHDTVALVFEKRFEQFIGGQVAQVNVYSGGTGPGNFEENLATYTVDDGGLVHEVLYLFPSYYADPSVVYIEFYYSTGGDVYRWKFCIDDVLLGVPTGSVLEYDETVVVPDLNATDTAIVQFPEWTPSDLGAVKGGAGDYAAYTVAACTELSTDGDQNNDCTSGPIILEYGGACDCMPGDADGDGKHLILDVTHLINYLYKNGPPPIPYEKCSGDADIDCSVLILDVTFLINYLYKNGPAPGSCEEWLLNCGSLQK